MNNRIIPKIKREYYLELLTAETMKLLGSTKSQITKDKNGKNDLDFKITEVALNVQNLLLSTKFQNIVYIYF